MKEWLLPIIGFLGFGLIHSWMAGVPLKRWFFQRWPKLKAFYRLIYTLISLMTFGLWYFLLPFPQGILYHISFPANFIFRLLQVAAVYGFWVTLRPIDIQSFLGLRQVLTFMQSGNLPSRLDESPSQQLITQGIYGYMRHPLYTFSMLILLFNPIMTYKLLLITLLAGIYFYIGSIYEEQKLLRIYGEAYREYQEQVPRFTPHLWRRS